jgi:two-component system LytT family sensor kinase
MRLSWLSKKWVAVLLHILCWTVLFSLPSLFRPSHESSSRPPEPDGFLYQYLLNCFTWIALFYVNAYILFPRLIYRKKYSQYALTIILIFIILFFINWFSFEFFISKRSYKLAGFVFFYFFPCLFILACSTAFTMFRDRLVSERLAKEKENANLKTELAFLRSQVSPHFMFNVLNNMVALARKKSDALEPSLIKLSSLLRYMLYETDEERVLLEREVEYLKSYIDLQVQRFGKKVKVNVQMEEFDRSYFIEPMLLIPFVENAFKHGTGLIENAEINIEMKVKNNMLQFSVSNLYNYSEQEIKDKTSGIGLHNVKRRLNLLYKDSHTLLICDKDNRFAVSLQLNLH